MSKEKMFKEVIDFKGEEITFTRIGKSNSLKMEFASLKKEDRSKGSVAISNLDIFDYIEILKVLIKFMKESEMDLHEIPLYKCFYTEVISVYIDEVERTISLSHKSFNFVAYGYPDEDYYMILRPSGIRELAGLILSGYLNGMKEDSLEKAIGKRKVADLERINHVLELTDKIKWEMKGLYKVTRDQLPKKDSVKELEDSLNLIVKNYLSEVLDKLIEKVEKL